MVEISTQHALFVVGKGHIQVQSEYVFCLVRISSAFEFIRNIILLDRVMSNEAWAVKRTLLGHAFIAMCSEVSFVFLSRHTEM